MLILTAALVAPLISASLAAAVSLSGKTGLADYEIAGFLLSPMGFAAALMAASLILVAGVLEVSVMMAVILSERRLGHVSIRAALGLVIGRLPVLIPFAGWFLLRLLAGLLPVAGLIALIGLPLISEHDINYYLSQNPPEFRRFKLIAAGIAALGGLGLIWLLLGWSMALPGVLFSGAGPRRAFGQSTALVRGQRLGLLRDFGLWALIAFAVSTGITALITAVAGPVNHAAEGDIFRSLQWIAVALVLWVVLFAVATTLTRGAFSVLLLDRAEEMGLPLSVEGVQSAAWRRGMLALAAGFVLLAPVGLYFSDQLLARVQGDHQVMVVAHRGAAGTRPENTLAAMEQAIVEGADWLELDVQESADGEVIVAHDSDFMKIAGVPTKIWEITAEELAEIDAGSWFAPEFAGEPVPRLAEVLELAKGRANVLIELKYYGHDVRLEERVAELVEAAGMADSIAIMSLEPEGVAKMQALRPDWKVGLLAATVLGDLTGRDVDFLALNASAATPHFVAHARDVGMPLLVWTVNTPEDMSRMISRGVDGLITDFPGRVAEVQAARAELSTAERLLLELGDITGLITGYGLAGNED
ncbi:MAG: glycerophosphoryl diester phosphodiesterase membrane domain-containing protein [Mangrovicoccus sp.]|nr:glycerophosphoryl diester phosphodiesterase membrane domain-containing protein [Mangrovicoccus sp.]